MLIYNKKEICIITEDKIKKLKDDVSLQEKKRKVHSNDRYNRDEHVT